MFKVVGDGHKIEEWKDALRTASNVLGFVYPEDRPETEFIDDIAKSTLKMLHDLCPCETSCLPGIESRSKELEELLMFGNDECVRTIGVLGMTGIGKTEVAKNVYKRNCSQFDGYDFVDDIDKELEWHQLCHLRENLLCKVLDVEKLDVRAHGILENYLPNKKLLEMHDLLQMMGKYIEYESSITKVGKRRRPWKLKDIRGILERNKGNKYVRGIFLNMSDVERIKLSPAAFLRMSNLKFLKFHSSHCSQWCDNDHKFQFCKGLDQFPDELVYLHWQGYPYDYLPSDFNPEELVYLNLRYSLIKELWEEEQTPETICLSNLKIFSFCESSIDDSTGLALLPFSGSSRLSDLYLANCNISRLPNNFSSSLHSLRCLCLSRNNIETLPESIEKLYSLLLLDLKHCRKLTSLPVFPSNLQCLDAHGCVSLENVAKQVKVPLVAERMHTNFIFTDCFMLDRAEQEAIGLVMDPLATVCFPGSDIPSWLFQQRMGSSIETDLVSHWCNSKFIGVSLSVVVSFKGHEDYHVNRLSVRCKCNFKNQNGQSISFSFSLGGWNDSCGSSCHEPRKLGSDHVFISYNKCNVPVFRWSEGSDEANRCRPTSAAFEFYLTDDTEKKLESCKVTRCGMSLLYAPDENDRGFQGTRVTDIVEHTSSEAFVPIRGWSHSQVGERRNDMLDCVVLRPVLFIAAGSSCSGKNILKMHALNFDADASSRDCVPNKALVVYQRPKVFTNLSIRQGIFEELKATRRFTAR
ncbi:hypothetical protein HID58_095484 [Brassica napus]|uniref:C-JID domain-containing protein n=1 Tax=Brassica napus TaxID=3708 RepID=A0ABQ7X5L4_BRANA|nr:hypothetical protein HID58_095484 [Brassica napus]